MRTGLTTAVTKPTPASEIDLAGTADERSLLAERAQILARIAEAAGRGDARATLDLSAELRNNERRLTSVQ